MKKVSGIYQITNTVNGRVYVGSAVNISDRWYRHKLHLRNGAHLSASLKASAALRKAKAEATSI